MVKKLLSWIRALVPDPLRRHDHSEADQAVDAHRQLLETVVNQMPAAVCLIHGSDLRLQLVNPAYQAIAPGKVMLGKTLDELWPETGQDFAAICRRVLESGEPYQVADELNMVHRRPDGPLEPAYFSWSVHRVQLPGGEGWGLLNAAWETTERKRVEAALEEERDRLAALISSIRDEVWFADADGQFTLVNPRGSREFDLQNGATTDIRQLAADLEVCRPDGTPRPIEEAPPLRALRGEVVTIDEELIRTPATGELRYRRVSAAPVRDGGGNIIGSVSVVRDVTGLKRAEEALRASELRFRQVVESLPQLVWTCRADGPCDYLSPQWVRYTGVPESPQLGYGWLDQLHPEDRDRTIAAWRATAARGEAFAIEFRIRRHDGVYRWFRTLAVPLRDDEGNIVKWFGSNTDFQDIREAEQSVRASEARLRQALEAGEVFTFEWDPASDAVLRSPNCRSILGWDSDATRDTGQSFFAAIHPEDREAFVRTVTRLTPEHPAYVATYRYLRRGDGREVVLEETGRAAFSNTGTMIGLHGLTRDVTERKRAEEALRESAARLRLAQASAGAGIWDWDIGTGTLEWSEELFRVFGLDPATHHASFESWRTVIHPDDRRLAEQRIEAAVANHASLASEYRIVLPSGEVRWISALGHATYDPEGTPRRMSGICIDITERKQAEALARDQEQQLELVTNTVPALIAYVDREFRYRRANQTYQYWFGMAPEQMKGRHVREVLGDAAWELARPRLERALAGEIVTYKERMPYRSGGERWVSTTLVPDRDAGGEIQGMVALVTDITELIHAEEDVRRSEERYRTLFESMGEGFALHEMIHDEHGRPCDYRFLEVNPSFGRLTGLDPRSIIGRTVREVIPTVEHSWVETYGRVARTGQSERFERYFAALDRWYEVFAYSPAPGRFATAFTDITARKQAEEALRQSREDLDRAQEVGQIGSWRLDVRNNVLAWSDQNYRLFGAAAGTPQTYDSFLETIHPDDREYVDAMWNAGLRGEPYDIEHRILVHGQVKWVREKAYLEFDEAGDLRGGFGITQDITERKRAEQQLRESLAEKELLLREIHHRVKNNLQVISSLVSLQADALADPALREVFGEVRDRVRSMALIHEKLYESGGLAKLNFADYVASLMKSIWSAHGVVGARVKLHLEVEPVAVSVATAVPCGLILNELASNALKHAFPSDGGEVTVGLRREPAAGRLRLWVHDNGVGMPADYDLRRARSLGLRLVQMLARQLEGTVETGSGPGPGTEFLIRFVATEVEEVPGLTKAASSTTGGGGA